MIDKLFTQLDDWRNLPNYQLERRADIFFAIHIPKIFDKIFGEQVTDIIPEFPIRIGTIYPSIPINKSYKADYVVYTDSQKAFLVELKTDNGSTRDNQVKYYFKSIEANYQSLLNGLIEIYNASAYKSKYINLLQKLEANGSLIRKELTFLPSGKFRFYESPVFIKPSRNPKDVGYIITYTDIIAQLEEEENPLTQRFLKSLNNWVIQV